MNSFGLLGDLCREVEWIWRRMQCANRSIQRCQDLRLEERLLSEISIHRNRCQAIKTILTEINGFIEPQSVQMYLLEELVGRCLSSAQVPF